MTAESSNRTNTAKTNSNNNMRVLLIGIGFLASIATTTNAFVLVPHSTTMKRPCHENKYGILSSRLVPVVSMSLDENAAFSDSDDNEEYDIDWNAMSSWHDQQNDDDDDELEAVFYDEQQEEEEEEEQEIRLSTTPRSNLGKNKGPSVEQRRVQMEMQWQLEEATDECIVEKPETCGSEPCADCHGKGWNDCRFCRGTAVLRLDKSALLESSSSSSSSLLDDDNNGQAPTTMANILSSSATARKKFILPSSFSACKICQQGVEMCRTCQGSGWVAGWTQLSSSSSSQGKNHHDKDDPPLP